MRYTISADLWANFLSIYDYLLLPFYIFVIYKFILWYRNKHYPEGHPWRKYFIWGITAKITGAVFIGLVYQYYYHGGDTSAYFYHAKIINSSLSESPSKWLGLIFHTANEFSGDYSEYISRMMWYSNMSSYLVCVFTAIISLFTFNTYLPTNVIFALITFSGNWAMFRLFAKQYPQQTRAVAIAVLFIPSIIVWGSGIFKDSICLAALGWLSYAVFKLLFERRPSIRIILTIIVSVYLLAVIKVYILLAFAPALLLWVLFRYTSTIHLYVVRLIIKLTFVLICIVAFVAISSTYEDELGRYSIENLASTSEITREYIYSVSQKEDASAYDLGKFEPTVTGFLKVAPKAINVTLFRPYIWEARKSMVLLNSIEATIFLFLTIKVFFVVGPFRVWKSISNDPNIQFFLMFSLVFAFSVGISSYNFGALSRYRIPCLPFYLLALVFIYYRYIPPNKKLFYFF